VRFSLIDRIESLTPGDGIQATKSLSLAEEYLKDHFPRFPVMPGVLMVESIFQASSWLISASEDFAHAMVVLRQVRNAKYAGFVEPGQVLTVTAEILKQDHETTTIRGTGSVRDKIVVNARLVVARYNLADQSPDRAATDDYLRRKRRQQFSVLYPRQLVSPEGS